MLTAVELSAVQSCRRDIEAKLNWGDSSNWSNYDFEKLSDLINAECSVQLSVSTLKRIWGKAAYKNTPSLTTLNALVRFLEYSDWRTYQQSYKKNVDTLPPAQQIPEPSQPKARVKRGLVLSVGLGLLLLIVALIGFTKFSGSKKAIDPDLYIFSANKIMSEGVPNSVIFTYDASAAQTDSVYIVQSWDIRRKTLVPRDKKHHSAIYYYPGFFHTRLIIDSTVVKAHDLMITSDGWLCLADSEPAPLYFKKEEYLKGDRVEVDTTILRTYNLTLDPRAPRIRFFNQRDLGDLMNDNFILETTLKNEFPGAANACHYVEVLIQCKNDIIIIPLAAKSCVGDLGLYVAGHQAQSKHADLSGFGCDLSQWTKLRVETKDKKMKLFVNDKEAYSLTIPNDPTGIVGLQYRFNGVGAVKDTRFIGKDTVYDFGPR